MKTLYILVFLTLSIHLNGQVLTDGFENWTQVVDTFLPDGWKASLNWIGTSKTVQRKASLTEGNYSVNIVDSIYGFEGPLPYSIRKRVAVFTDTVDITFSYKCVGEGFCKVWLGQALSDTSVGYNEREVWSVAASSDTSIHTAIIQNVGVNPPFTVFSMIGLESSPIITPLNSYGITHFTVDLLAVSSRLALNMEEVARESNWVVQNPVHDILQVFASGKETFSSIRVFNSVGELVSEATNSRNADVSNLSTGFYLVQVSNGKQSQFFKIMKY